MATANHSGREGPADPVATFRAPETLLIQARALAKGEGESFSALVRRGLELLLPDSAQGENFRPSV